MNMKKRILRAILSLLLVASIFPSISVAAADSPSSWAVEAVTRADSLGLIPSELNNNYTQHITRAEFCALAVPVYEKFTGTTITQLRDFTDTTDINVRKIGSVNVVSGTGNGAFNPDGEIMRQEAAVILTNLMSALGEPLSASEPTFADNAQIDSWALNAVGQVQKAGIMAGTGNNNFTPKGDAGKYTREQSIVTLLKVWDIVEKTETVENTGDTAATKVLVAYFSCTGNTRTLAEYAADALSADIYEIQPEIPYTSADLNYSDNSSRSSREMNDSSSRPAIFGTVENMEEYDIVFLGYPIWWGQAPQIISTFLESYDFSGKTIIPFCTSGSSGIGSSATNLQMLCADSAIWLPGTRFSGSASRNDVATWLEGLNIE